MTTPTRKTAPQPHRTRQTRPGIARFEVQAPESDRALLRALALRLATGGRVAAQARATLERLLSSDSPASGGILAALRRSPLVGANLNLDRHRGTGRDPTF